MGRLRNPLRVMAAAALLSVALAVPMQSGASPSPVHTTTGAAGVFVTWLGLLPVEIAATDLGGGSGTLAIAYVPGPLFCVTTTTGPHITYAHGPHPASPTGTAFVTIIDFGPGADLALVSEFPDFSMPCLGPDPAFLPPAFGDFVIAP